MSGQNRSTAVMQRRVEAPDSLDDFPTPPWATRALCEVLINRLGLSLARETVLEPACNRGFMARPLAEYFRTVEASDIHDYGFGAVRDFLPQTLLQPTRIEHAKRPAWCCTNPPFNLAGEFVREGLARVGIGVAMFVRVAWLESEERYRDLFSNPATRPSYWLQFVERVVLLQGRLVRAGAVDPKTGKKASTATAYGWAIWMIGEQPDWMKTGWIAPCRQRLERPGDYPEYPPGYFAETA